MTEAEAHTHLTAPTPGKGDEEQVKTRQGRGSSAARLDKVGMMALGNLAAPW